MIEELVTRYGRHSMAPKLAMNNRRTAPHQVSRGT
jgi:hypothetical protein